MSSLNKVFLLGNLTREPELRYTPGGSAVGEFGLAVNRKFNDKEEVCFVDIVVWGKQAETCHRYLEKGVSVLIEGRLQLDQWQDKESGAKRSRLRVVAERVQFLGRGPGQGAADGSGYPQDDYSAMPEEDGGSYRQEPPPQRQSYQSQPPPQQQQYQQQYQQPQYQQPPRNNGGYRQAPPQSRPAQAPAPAGAAAPRQAPPPPPMPPEGAFDVAAEDDIPF